METIGKQFHFIDCSDWRAWLEAHHAIAQGVWLVHYKKHSGKPCLSLEDAVEEALCFGWIDGVLKPIMLCTSFRPRRG